MIKPKLNTEKMARLYDFGGLFAYRVETLCPITWKPRTEILTFSEERARSIAAKWKLQGVSVRMSSELIQFDGAFAEMEMKTDP